MQLLRILAQANCLALYSLTSAYTPLSDDSLRALKVVPHSFDIDNFDAGLLAPILIPRVSGTEGNKKVQQFFLDFFQSQLPSWDIALQNSTSKTPATGDRDVPFTNIIASRDPPWTAPGEANYLTLVAHFDSKLTPTGFIGATDSAAPCAMLLHAARSLDSALTAKWASMQADAGFDPGFGEEEKGLQILLLDGEEAFVSWTHTDSLYGARSLAEQWESDTSGYGAMSAFPNRLGSISLFVLLDLLGSTQPYTRVPSYFRTTHWAYKAMGKVEKRLRGLNDVWASESGSEFLHESGKDETNPTSQWLGGLVEDDHLPFMARGVEVLHLIPNPFPQVWHTMDDDGAHLDIPTVEDWAKIVTVFTAEWMDLEGYVDKPAAKRQEKTEL